MPVSTRGRRPVPAERPPSRALAELDHPWITGGSFLLHRILQLWVFHFSGMKMPTNLKIGGHEFKVIYRESWKGSGEDAGMCDYDTLTIYIKSTLPESLQVSTLLHEVFHAINTTLDHTLLDSLAEQFAQVLLDNKALVWTSNKP